MPWHFVLCAVASPRINAVSGVFGVHTLAGEEYRELLVIQDMQGVDVMLGIALAPAPSLGSTTIAF